MTLIATTDLPCAGDELHNGALVLEAKLTHGQVPCAIVLAFAPQSVYDPFVTWLVRLEDLTATSGHYFRKIEDAVTDFKERS